MRTQSELIIISSAYHALDSFISYVHTFIQKQRTQKKKNAASHIYIYIYEREATVEGNLGVSLSAMMKSLMSFMPKIEYKNILNRMIQEATVCADNM